MPAESQVEDWPGVAAFMAGELARRDWGVGELASRAGVARGTVSAALNRERMTPIVAAAIARGLGWRVDEMRARVARPAPPAGGAPSPSDSAHLLPRHEKRAPRVMESGPAYGAGYWQGRAEEAHRYVRLIAQSAAALDSVLVAMLASGVLREPARAAAEPDADAPVVPPGFVKVTAKRPRTAAPKPS